jgi:hypothetical protein
MCPVMVVELLLPLARCSSILAIASSLEVPAINSNVSQPTSTLRERMSLVLSTWPTRVGRLCTSSQLGTLTREGSLA